MTPIADELGDTCRDPERRLVSPIERRRHMAGLLVPKVAVNIAPRQQFVVPSNVLLQRLARERESRLPTPRLPVDAKR